MFKKGSVVSMSGASSVVTDSKSTWTAGLGSMLNAAATRVTGGGGGGNREGSKGGGSDDGESSFADEMHTMTKAEAEYQLTEAEHEVLDEITKEVRERIVFGKGSASYGLKWRAGTVNEPRDLVGGWLSQVRRGGVVAIATSAAPIYNGSFRFCILDDEARSFRQCLDEQQKVRRQMVYDDITTVRPRVLLDAETKKLDSPNTIFYFEVFSKTAKWELMPIKPNEREVVVRWVAALQARTNTFDASIAADATRALRVALWMQSIYRMKKAMKRVQRRRERHNALRNRLAQAMGMGGWDAGDSDEDDDDAYEEGYAAYAVAWGSNVLTSAWSAVGSWLGLGGAAPLLEEGEEDDAAAAAAGATGKAKDPLARTKGMDDDADDARMRRDSAFVQFSNELPALGPNEIEDEVWENQRWDPINGWGPKALGPADRAAFSDRVGRNSFASPANDPQGGVPMEKGWRAVKPEWQVDTSGTTKGRCDKEGWMYSSSFPMLDGDLAQGKFIAHNPGGLQGFVCRRRRWYRRRVPDESVSQTILNTTPPIIVHGWLGTKASSSGRWRSRMFVLTRPGLELGTLDVTHRSAALMSRPVGPSLTSFRFSFRGADEVLANGGLDPAKWKGLTDAQASTVELDPRYTRVDESIATPTRPGYFALILDDQGKRTRVFNANDARARTMWCVAIDQALRDASRSGRPRTLRLVGGAFETTSYPTIVMDSIVAVPVDAMEEAFFQSPAVLAATHVRQGFTNIKVKDWSKEGQRVIEYDDPMNHRGHVTETWVRARTEPGAGFIVDRRIEAPQAQFGDEFCAKLRVVLVAAEYEKQVACRIIASVDVEFLKKTMMVGFITSSVRTHFTTALADYWMPAVVGYLEGKGLVKRPPGGGSAVKRLPSAGAGSSSAASSASGGGGGAGASPAIQVKKF